MNRRALPVIAAVAVVGLGLDVLIGYSPVVGYGAAIGLFGTIVLTLVAKKAMAPALQRDEDFYPLDISPEVEHDVYGVRSDHAGVPVTGGTRSEAPGGGEPGDHDPGDHDPGDHDPGDHDPGDRDPGDRGGAA